MNSIMNSDVIEIKLMNIDDVLILEEYGKSLDEESKAFFRPHNFDENSIKDILPNKENLAYVAIYNNKPFACFFLFGISKPFPCLGIGIEKNFQNKKLGSKFLDILIEKAKEINRNGIELTCTEGNDRAFYLYKKKGFIYYKNEEGRLNDGRCVIERAMYLPLKQNAKPDDLVITMGAGDIYMVGEQILETDRLAFLGGMEQ